MPPPRAFRSMSTEASFEKKNRLASEKSPYLLQHSTNPVSWYPWGQEAFDKAKTEDKMIFLSVGYSTCHWCHVMERESFESDEIGHILNENFVSIKVDREERPDVDKIYMTFVQATSGGGGWPMSVWLTPDLKPIVGGTYFPPDDRYYGRPGFKSILLNLAKQIFYYAVYCNSVLSYLESRFRLWSQMNQGRLVVMNKGMTCADYQNNGTQWDVTL